MLEFESKRQFSLGRFAALGVALLVAACGAWLLLSPGGARSAVHDWSARWAAGKSGPISLAAGVRNGGFYRLGEELSEAVHATGPFSLEVVETNGSVDNLKRLRAGQLNFALVQGGLLSNPATGDTGTAAAEVLPVANVDKQYVHLIVPAESPIHSVRDLAGKRVGVGPAGSGHEALASLVLKYFDFSPAPVLVTEHSPDLEQAFQANSIDAAFAVYNLFSPAMDDLFKNGGFRLVPMPESEAVAKFIPGVYAENLPPDLYGPERTAPAIIDGPLPTLMVHTYLVARRDAPEAQVRAVLEALYNPALRYAARLADLDEQHGRNSPLGPLHPAAAAWYARSEPLSTDRFEVASFFLAGLVTLASTVQYLMGRRQWLHSLRSRRAIRPYFERLLEYGGAVEQTNDTSALSSILHDMMATQREAEREWLAGRLNTEHMENLYLIFNTRTRNAFDKIHQLHLQALIEGGPLPGTYHPEPARPIMMQPNAPIARPNIAAPDDAAPRAMVETYFSDAAPEPMATVSPAVAAPAVQTTPSGIGTARPQQKKKNRGGRPAGQGESVPQSAARPKPAAPLAPVAAAAPIAAAASSPAPTAPAPRQLSDWEVEMKYQRSDDYAADFESGIVSAPRPRRVQSPSDGTAPARADLGAAGTDPTAPDDSQLEMF